MLEPLSLLNLLISIGLIIGGVVAYYHGFSRTANEVQERVIHAQQSEIQTLHDRIATVEQENARLSYIVTTICSALKQLGIHITIDGDTISIHDHNSSDVFYHSRIYGTEATNAQEEHEPGSHCATTEAKPSKRRGKKSMTSQEA
ncbi:MAG TPA: hypothetical protein VFU49_13190 [Ktedonobacteraceae bacterium]|nr:hypothetical protein [Ktedonobacteraceae bacterium]